jgi:hypothetical protein
VWKSLPKGDASRESRHSPILSALVVQGVFLVVVGVALLAAASSFLSPSRDAEAKLWRLNFSRATRRFPRLAERAGAYLSWSTAVLGAGLGVVAIDYGGGAPLVTSGWRQPPLRASACERATPAF